jgi:hypothetical protein
LNTNGYSISIQNTNLTYDASTFDDEEKKPSLFIYAIKNETNATVGYPYIKIKDSSTLRL